MSELRAKNLNVGDRVHHTTFGEGLVTKYEQPFSDVIVTVTFNDSGSKRLLLNQAPMEIIEKYTAPLEKIEEYKAPLEKIKEHKSPHVYTTEFKIKVVKQALSEGRTVIRKHYKLPETTLRSWIKQFNNGTQLHT